MKYDAITKEIYYRLFTSTFIIQIALATYSVSDEVIIGNFLGEVALAASSLVLPVFMLMTAMMDMIAIGGTNIFSSEVGKGDTKSANRYFSATIAVAACMGLLVSVLALFFVDPLVHLFGAKGEMVSLTKEYLVVIIYSIPIMLVYTCMEFFVRNDGKPNLALASNITFIVINICFNIYFVGYTDMGIAGAGWATILAIVIALFVTLLTFFSKTNTLHFCFSFSFRDIFFILKTGCGMATKYIYKMLTILLFNNLIMHYYHYEGIVVYTVIFNMLMLVTAIFEGVRNTIQPIVSTYIGEGNNRGIREVMHIARNNASLLCIITILLLEVFPESVSYLFGIEDQQLIPLINQGIRIYAFVILFMTFNEVMSYYYQFVNQLKISFIVMTLKGLVVLLPCNLLLMYLGGLNGLWLGFVLTEMITGALLILIARRIAKKSNNTLSQFLLLEKKLDVGMLSISMRANKNVLIDSIRQIEEFLNRNDVDELQKTKMILSVEEIVLNIIEHNHKQHNALIEIQVILGENISLIIRDNCKNFDPTKNIETKDAEKNLGLKIIKGVSTDFQYVPTIGYNRVILTF